MIAWSVAIGALFGVVLLALGDVVPRLFTSDEAVIAKANEIWPLFALMMPFNGAVFALDGILIGAGDTRFLMWGMLAAAAVYLPDRAAHPAVRLGHRRSLVGTRRTDRRSSSYVRCALRKFALGVDRRSGLTTLVAPMTRRIALITTLLALALAAPAGAQSGAFGPLPAARADRHADADGHRLDSTETGRNVLFIIGGALIIGFGVMGWLILRDARTTSTKELEDIEHDKHRSVALHKRQQQQKAKARKRTSAQRKARKVQQQQRKR